MDKEYNNENFDTEYKVIDLEDEQSNDYGKQNEGTNLIEFQRIDWNKPETIASYGADLLSNMGKIESNKNALSSNSESNRDKINELIAKIESFIENMSKDIEREEKVEKKQEQSKELVILDDAIEKTSRGLRKLGKIMKRGYIRIKTSGQTDSFNEAEFNNFKDNLRELSSLIDIERENIEQEVKIYYDYLTMIAPYFTTLEYLIKEGKNELKSREEYLDQTYGKKQLDKFESLDYSLELKTVKRLVERLRRLEDQLFVFKTQIYEAKLTLDNDEEISILYKEYNDITVPSLESKGESMLKVKVQRDRINTLMDLDNMTNDAYKTTSRVISANIDDVIKMQSEGTYKVDTMKELVTNIQKGIDAVNNANKLTLKIEGEKAKLRESLNRTISSDTLLEDVNQTQYLIGEASSEPIESAEVARRGRK